MLAVFLFSEDALTETCLRLDSLLKLNLTYDCTGEVYWPWEIPSGWTLQLMSHPWNGSGLSLTVTINRKSILIFSCNKIWGLYTLSDRGCLPLHAMSRYNCNLQLDLSSCNLWKGFEVCYIQVSMTLSHDVQFWERHLLCLNRFFYTIPWPLSLVVGGTLEKSSFLGSQGSAHLWLVRPG